jgi:hypothetical protein
MSSGAEARRTSHRELASIRAGLREDAQPLERAMIPLFGRIGAVAGLYQSFYERFLSETRLARDEASRR